MIKPFLGNGHRNVANLLALVRIFFKAAQMEKEITSRRGNNSLPNCVAIVLALLVLVSLSMCALALWQIDGLKQEMRHQEVEIRELKASQNNKTSEDGDLATLHRTVGQLKTKV